MMKRRGRAGSIEGKIRERFKSEADELEDMLEESAGTKTPVSRKDLMFDMRRIEEADGDRRIMGSGLLAGALGL